MRTGVRIGVLIGGSSSENDASLISARSVLPALEELGYVTKPILITSDQSWYVYGSKSAYHSQEHESAFGVNEVVDRLPHLVDAIFITMHGSFGEDGSVQRLLDRAGVPYQGSGVRASQLAFDKHATSQLLRRAGFAVPDYNLIERAKWVVARARIIRQIIAVYGLPVVVKPNANSGGIDVMIARTATELAESLELVSARHGRVIAQRYIRGYEFSCGVIEQDGQAIAFPPTYIREIDRRPRDYHVAKTLKNIKATTPTPFSDIINTAISRTALGVHRALKLQGYSQVDMILSQRRLWILEVNTLPKLADSGLLAQGAHAMGIAYIDLIEKFTQYALTRPEVVELS